MTGDMPRPAIVVVNPNTHSGGATTTRMTKGMSLLSKDMPRVIHSQAIGTRNTTTGTPIFIHWRNVHSWPVVSLNTSRKRDGFNPVSFAISSAFPLASASATARLRSSG